MGSTPHKKNAPNAAAMPEGGGGDVELCDIWLAIGQERVDDKGNARCRMRHCAFPLITGG